MENVATAGSEPANGELFGAAQEVLDAAVASFLNQTPANQGIDFAGEPVSIF